MEYLHAHPSAADTLEGIVQWWLPHRLYEMEKEDVGKALDDLVEQGVVEYISTGGKKIFRLATPKPPSTDE
ncbi:hypothetical protein [Nitrosospira sp. Is2]|uniref:hypothetical protein n=1 Tax=Nitrosospira sp. Is2 TaxID=3080532 RepID=UPI002954D49F|nr:hypothetical protein [Nitrosospira sp. Is2]WON73529.1 hypothetical protein R5L00_13765 [Nitrosospira sp. Is2]